MIQKSLYHAILNMIEKERLIKIVTIVVSSIIAITILFLLIKVLSVVFNDENSLDENKEYLVIANSSTSFLRSGDSEVTLFLGKAEEKEISFESENSGECYNVTPNIIGENSEYKIFKFADTGETYLLFDDEIYRLGNNRGGYGPISFALADVDNDEKLELYFSYTWDTGVYRSNIAYFNPVEKKVKGFNNVYYREQEVILIVRDNELCVSAADVTEYIDNANLKMTSGKSLARILLQNGEIILKEIT